MIVWPTIADILRRGEPCFLVTIEIAEGSTPRETGTRMVISGAGFSGTIGGGELELQAITFAQNCLKDNRLEVTHRSFSLGPDLGQCCGGRVELRFEGFDKGRFDEVAPLAAAEREGPVKTLGRLTGGKIHRSIIRTEDLLADEKVDLHETFGIDRTYLAIFGAGHVAKALILALAPLPFRVTLYDNRADVFPNLTASNITSIHTNDPAGIVAQLPEKSQILVMTHSHTMDLEIVAAALTDARFDFLGLIGSQTKYKRFVSQLRALNFDDATISRINCPIGIGEIRSKDPPSIAIAIAAQLLIERERAALEGI